MGRGHVGVSMLDKFNMNMGNQSEYAMHLNLRIPHMADRQKRIPVYSQGLFVKFSLHRDSAEARFLPYASSDPFEYKG